MGYKGVFWVNNLLKLYCVNIIIGCECCYFGYYCLVEEVVYVYDEFVCELFGEYV